MTDRPDTAVPEIDISCPSCGAELSRDELFLSVRVCSHCHRHFSMPATERVTALLDSGSYRPLRQTPGEPAMAADMQASALDRLASARERSVVRDAIVVGTGELGGIDVVIIALDDQLVGSQIGALGAEKIILALDYALSRRLPVIGLIAGGANVSHVGPLANVQGVRIANIAAEVQAMGIPMIGIVSHPTSAAVFGLFATLFDLLFAEPGASVGVVWTPDRPIDALVYAIPEEELLRNGWIDGVLPRPDQHARLAGIVGLLSHNVSSSPPERPALPIALDRPLAEYLEAVAAPFTELRGDRVEYDDRGVVTGIGLIEDIPVALVVQDAHGSTNTTAAIRKIQRVARFAGRFELPLVMVADGATPTLPYTVTPGESFAAAKLKVMMSVVPIPVISIGAGKVQGTVSHLMMSGDRRLMAEHASYQINGGSMQPNVASVREWGARESMRMGLIDQVIEMPAGGVLADPWLALRMVYDNVHTVLEELGKLGPRKLVERRARANRELGHTEEGLAAILGELHEWQDVQQSISKSIDEWRARLDQRRTGGERRDRNDPWITLPNFQKPDLGELAARLKAAQEQLASNLMERTGRGTPGEDDQE